MLPALCAAPLGWVLYSPIKVGSNLERKEYQHDVSDIIWRNVTSYDLSESVLRWGFPPNPFDWALTGAAIEGTGNGDAMTNGITWALHPDFCKDLKPKFPEENFDINVFDLVSIDSLFLSCSDLRRAVTDAFNTWALNHKKLQFVDVTSLCTAENIVEDPLDPTSFPRCKYAEVLIHAGVGDQSGADLAAFVINSFSNMNRKPWTTAGVQLPHGDGLRESRMAVSTDICWYLDTTFCYNFHRWDESGQDVVLTMRLVFAAFYVASGIIMLWVLGGLARSLMCPDRTLLQRNESDLESANKKATCGGPRCDALLRFLAEMPLAALLFAMFWIIFMPIFYWRVFLPCWECYDFQATIAHEVGHILGFDHPDVLQWLNLKIFSAEEEAAFRGTPVPNVTAPELPQPMNNLTCRAPLEHATLAELPAGADSIMFSTTKHRDRTCLTVDDLEGLNFLYPSCFGALAEPECDVAKRGTGFLRLAIAVGFPYVLVTMILFCTQCCVRSYQQRQLKKLEDAVQSLRVDRQALRHRLAGVPRIMSRSRSGGMWSGVLAGVDDIMHGRIPGMTPRGGRGTSPDDRTPRGTHWRTPRRAFSGRFTGRSGRLAPPGAQRSNTSDNFHAVPGGAAEQEEAEIAAAMEASRLSAVAESGRERGWSEAPGSQRPHGRGASNSGGSLPPTADALRGLGGVAEDSLERHQSLGSISVDSRDDGGPLEIGDSSHSTSAVPIAVSTSPVGERNPARTSSLPPAYTDPHMASVSVQMGHTRQV